MCRKSLVLCMLCMLLSVVAGCGEIELPVKEDEHPQQTQPSQPEKPTETDGSGEPDTPQGSGDPQEPDSPTTPGDETGESGGQEQQVGEACFTADGHLLIADSFYLSISNVKGVVSAYNEDTPEAADQAAADYKEGNLTSGWRIPTEEEARTLLSLYASTTYYYGPEPLPVLNRALETMEYDMISFSERYLCADGTKTFCFEQGKKVTKAGAKKEYYLRLVHAK